MTKLSANAENIRLRLCGVRVIGPPPHVSELMPFELGALAALVWADRSVEPDPLVGELQEALQVRAPRFDEASAVAALGALIESAGARGVHGWMLDAAARVVAGCEVRCEVREGVDAPAHPASPPAGRGLQGAASPPAPSGLRRRVSLPALVVEALVQLLGCCPPGDRSPLMAALRACAGQMPPEDPDVFAAREKGFLCALEQPADRIFMARVCSQWDFGVDDGELTPRGADPLTRLPGYLEFARQLVGDARAHIAQIQSGEAPYRAERAFAVDGAQAVRRALVAGLDRDAEWAARAAGPLFSGAAIAPGRKARSAPSQSAAVAFAKAIAARPSVPVVSDLKDAVGRMRHAGLKKKVAHFLKLAERRLLERDDFLLELDPKTRLPASMRTTVVRALEALIRRTEPLPFEQWRALLTHPLLAAAASGLVWWVGELAVLPMRSGKWFEFFDRSGADCQPAPGPVSLWHPLDENAQTAAWRRLILAREIQQPFNQAFRETYTQASLPALLSVELDVRVLLGLARAQGWWLGYELVRRIGPLLVRLDVGGVHPGARGITRCYAARFFRASDDQAIELADEDPKIVSECLRAIDLLVSVSAFALPPDAGVASAKGRRAALLAMLGANRSDKRPYVDGRRVRVGDVSISIGTGRATRDGAELAVPAGEGGAVLPYPDEVLRRIVTGVNYFWPS